ncbi:hypothetical protein [Streptococcus sanguinis]|uniref:hypothetical protein n=1 Tax=Streptococcus sanguinis TaxID=1305 RepID=UPI002284AC93|nr:hypothetical protein [Streptococcus sanguinis]MCY7021496.1 hypothetical protein [Streptococcus sanguinis]
MDKQKLASFAFGITGLDLDKLLEGLGISEKLERQEIQKAVNDFKKYILERHGNNPSYDSVDRFWKENQVFEELVRIRYALDSEFKRYSEFKSYLSERIDEQSPIKQLSDELIDEFEKYLSDTIEVVSKLPKSDAARHKKWHEETKDEITSLSVQNSKQHQEILEAIKQVTTPDISDLDWFVTKEEDAMLYEYRSTNSDCILKNSTFWFLNRLNKDYLDSEIEKVLNWIDAIDNKIKIIENFTGTEVEKSLFEKEYSLSKRDDFQEMVSVFKILGVKNHYLKSSQIFRELFFDGGDSKLVISNFAEIGDIKPGTILSDKKRQGSSKFITHFGKDGAGGPAQLIYDFSYYSSKLLVIEGEVLNKKVYSLINSTPSGYFSTKNIFLEKDESYFDEDSEVIDFIKQAEMNRIKPRTDKMVDYQRLSQLKEYFIDSM